MADLNPVDPATCAEEAGAALGNAVRAAVVDGDHNAALALVAVADAWRDLGVTLAQNPALRRDDDTG